MEGVCLSQSTGRPPQGGRHPRAKATGKTSIHRECGSNDPGEAPRSKPNDHSHRPKMRCKWPRRGIVRPARRLQRGHMRHTLLKLRAPPKQTKQGTGPRTTRTQRGTTCHVSLRPTTQQQTTQAKHRVPSPMSEARHPVAATDGAAQANKAGHCASNNTNPARRQVSSAATVEDVAQATQAMHCAPNNTNPARSHVPSVAAAKDADRTAQARHRVLSPKTKARHHVPSVAAAQSTAQEAPARHQVPGPMITARHRTPGVAAAEAAAQAKQAKHRVPDDTNAARHHVPNVAAAQGAAQTTQARHRVPHPRIEARHHMPGAADVEGASQAKSSKAPGVK